MRYDGAERLGANHGQLREKWEVGSNGRELMSLWASGGKAWDKSGGGRWVFAKVNTSIDGATAGRP